MGAACCLGSGLLLRDDPLHLETLPLFIAAPGAERDIYPAGCGPGYLLHLHRRAGGFLR